MSATKYYQVTEREWIRIPRRGHIDQCCDCGLTHRLNYRIVNGALEMQTFLDKRATAATRRKKK